MKNIETAIYATIYCNDLNEVERSLKRILFERNFKRIEQDSVLLYEDNLASLSIEYNNESFYLSGSFNDNLQNSKPFIQLIANQLKVAGIHFSLDYQEENENCEPTTPEYNISNKD